MPALSLLGQKTCLAGDDLFLPSILFIGLRLLQLAVLLPLTAVFAKDNDNGHVGCSDEDARHDLIDKYYPIFVSYIVVAYVLVAAGLYVEVGICRATGKGTPTQPEKRNSVRHLCHAKLVPFSVMRIVAITLGLFSVQIFKSYCNCVPDPETAMLLTEECDTLLADQMYFRILVSTHCIEGFSVGFIFIYFFCKCTPNTPSLVDAQTKWGICCHCCMSTLSIATCCCLGGREVGDYSDIAMVLADYFNDEGTLDIVTSDIVMALLMLLRVQNEQREACVNEVLEQTKEYQQEHKNVEHDECIFSSAREIQEVIGDVEVFQDARDVEQSSDSDSGSIDSTVARLALAELHETSRHRLSQSVVFQLDRADSTGRVFYRPVARAVLMPSNTDDVMAVAEGARFMRYARAMYSWKMDVIEKPISSCVTFGIQLARSCCSRRNEKVEGDNRFGFNGTSLESFANLEPDQLVYASFTEGIGKIPFCVVIDHEWKSVVISIRGTLSLEDAVTDISLRPESMEECGTRCGFDGRLCYAHAGMLSNSEWVYSELERYE